MPQAWIIRTATWPRRRAGRTGPPRPGWWRTTAGRSPPRRARLAAGEVHRRRVMGPGRARHRARHRARRVGAHIGQGLGAARPSRARADPDPRGVRVGHQPGVGHLPRRGPRAVRGERREHHAAPGCHTQLTRAAPGGEPGEQPPLRGADPAQGSEDGHGVAPVRPGHDARRRRRAGRAGRAGRAVWGSVSDTYGFDALVREPRRQAVGGHGVLRGQFAHPPRPRTARPGPGQELHGGQRGGARRVLRPHLQPGPRPRRAGAHPQHGSAVPRCDQCHIRAQCGHIAPAVVHREQETPRQAGQLAPRAGAQRRVQLPRPRRDIAVSGAVEAAQRGRHDVAYPVVPVGGQQSGGPQSGRQLAAAGRGQAADLEIAPRGEVQPTVPQLLARPCQRLRLTCRQQAARHGGSRCESGAVPPL
jgi:hypothetical protein